MRELPAVVSELVRARRRIEQLVERFRPTLAIPAPASLKFIALAAKEWPSNARPGRGNDPT